MKLLLVVIALGLFYWWATRFMTRVNARRVPRYRFTITRSGGAVDEVLADDCAGAKGGSLVFTITDSTGITTRTRTVRVYAPGSWVTVDPAAMPRQQRVTR